MEQKYESISTCTLAATISFLALSCGEGIEIVSDERRKGPGCTVKVHTGNAMVKREAVL